MYYCVETLVALHTLHDHEYVSTVAHANSAFRSLAVQVLGSFGGSLGIHFGHLFVIFQ